MEMSNSSQFTLTFSTIISYVTSWFIFIKMGRKGWEGIIPFYNIYVLFEELYGNGWRMLTLLIPFYNIYVIFKLYIDLAHKFGQSTAFGWGLIFLNPIFMCIMAFSNNIQCEGGTSVDVLNKMGIEFGDNSSKLSQADVDDLKHYKDLYDAGVIGEEEYEDRKNEILNR